MIRIYLAYWAVMELGISGTKIGKRLGLSRSAGQFKEVNNWFQSIDYSYTIPETHDFMGVPAPVTRQLLHVAALFLLTHNSLFPILVHQKASSHPSHLSHYPLLTIKIGKNHYEKVIFYYPNNVDLLGNYKPIR